MRVCVCVSLFYQCQDNASVCVCVSLFYRDYCTRGEGSDFVSYLQKAFQGHQSTEPDFKAEKTETKREIERIN